MMKEIDKNLSDKKFSGLSKDKFEIAFTEEEISRRIEELAKEISQDYAHKDLILVSMLKGSVHFLSDLSRRISIPHLFDCIAIKNRVGNNNSGVIELSRDITIDIEDKDVLVLEEVVRTGFTTNFMIQHLERKNPRSIKLAAFLSNPKQMLLDLPLRYVGFEIDFDRYVGYGLDYKEYGRSLPFIAKLNPEIFKDVNLPNSSAVSKILQNNNHKAGTIKQPRWIKGNKEQGFRI